MSNQYKEIVESDEILNKLFFEKYKEIELLNKEQIEKFIFYLKNIDVVTDGGSNNWNDKDKFIQKLDSIRNSDEQSKMMFESRKLFRFSSSIYIFCGIIFTLTVILLFTSAFY